MALRLLIAILILAVPLELPGCGPFFPTLLAVNPEHPEQPDFDRGNLGILQPTYYRHDLFIAYRYLTGVGLNDEERRAVTPSDGDDVDAQIERWLAARDSIKGVKKFERQQWGHAIDPEREVKKDGYFDSYLNCNADAFRAAADTLAQRIKPLGDTAAADWITAQDNVFADCSKGVGLPPPASDPRLAAARAYQIASAKFYSEQYDAARQDFQAIAADKASPWRDAAPYLGARCLIRSGKYAEAETALLELAADPTGGRYRQSAARLLGFVRLRARPAERMHELALAIVKPNSQATLGQDLIDYRALFDKSTKPQPSDDLTEWITAMQGGGGALEKWRSLHTAPWLVAALQAAKTRDQAVPDLLAAAAMVKSDSPAYVTVSYHSVRLLPPDAARAKAEELLGANIPESARNQFRAERMRLAQTFDDFLRYAPRHAVAESGADIEPPDPKHPQDFLDDDSLQVLQKQMSVSGLKQAAASTLLPAGVRQQIARAIHVREILLTTAPSFDDVFTLLKTPGMRPTIDSPTSRFFTSGKLSEIDNYRDNWWCSLSRTGSNQNVAVVVQPSVLPREGPQPTDAPVNPPILAFLSPAERNQAAAEWMRLETIPAAPDWLAAQTLAFAQSHPQDPRIPEALYLVVRASRFGCTDDQTGAYSERAFNLLHRRYPTSEWAKKTPFWYK